MSKQPSRPEDTNTQEKPGWAARAASRTFNAARDNVGKLLLATGAVTGGYFIHDHMNQPPRIAQEHGPELPIRLADRESIHTALKKEMDEISKHLTFLTTYASVNDTRFPRLTVDGKSGPDFPELLEQLRAAVEQDKYMTAAKLLEDMEKCLPETSNKSVRADDRIEAIVGTVRKIVASMARDEKAGVLFRKSGQLKAIQENEALLNKQLGELIERFGDMAAKHPSEWGRRLKDHFDWRYNSDDYVESYRNAEEAERLMSQGIGVSGKDEDVALRGMLAAIKDAYGKLLALDDQKLALDKKEFEERFAEREEIRNEIRNRSPQSGRAIGGTPLF